MTDNKLSIDPYNPSYWHIISKGMIWFVVWIIVAFLVFAVTVLFNGTIQKWLWTISSNGALSGWVNGSPALALVLLFIAFMVSFIWNIMISTIYGLAYSDKYYNTSKTIWHTIFVNLILFVSLAGIYFVYSNDIGSMFMILALHIVFALYISHNVIEYNANPNYSMVYMIWNTAWMTLFITIFLVLFKFVSMWTGGANNLSGAQSSTITILLSIPAILSYSIIPFISAVWEKIYYGIYTLGSNFLYISSLDEVTVDYSDNQNINVVWDNSNDINVDM